MCIRDFFFQAEDGIRDRSPSRGLGDVYKRQGFESPVKWTEEAIERLNLVPAGFMRNITQTRIEQRAQENDIEEVTLDFAARVIEDGRSLANEVLGQYYQ